MTDYSQSVDFSAKDALTTGDPDKLVKGSDIDTELALISTAIASKTGDAENNTVSGNWTHSGTTTFSGAATFSGAVDGLDWQLLGSVTASSDRPAFTSGLSSTYRAYKIILENIVPTNDNSHLSLRTSTDGGSNYDQGASDYQWAINSLTATTGTGDGFQNSSGSTRIQLTDHQMGSATNEQLCGEVTLYNPAGTGFTMVHWSLTHLRATDGAVTLETGAGARMSAADVDAIQFSTTGAAETIASGALRLYGLRNA